MGMKILIDNYKKGVERNRVSDRDPADSLTYMTQAIEIRDEIDRDILSALTNIAGQDPDGNITINYENPPNPTNPSI
jgi:hypothetical protein